MNKRIEKKVTKKQIIKAFREDFKLSKESKVKVTFKNRHLKLEVKLRGVDAE